MTPFAHLGLLQKSAYQAPPTNYEYAVNPDSGLRDPYSPYTPKAGTPQAAAAAKAQAGFGWGDAGALALDVAAGSNPFTGVPYFGYKAVNDFSKGNIWSGIGNLGWGALSFLPGVGAAAGAAGKGIIGGLGRLGAKMTPKAIQAIQTGAKLTPRMSKGIMAGGMGAGVGGMVGDMATGQSEPPPAPVNPNASSQGGSGSLIDSMAQSMIQNKPV